MLTGSIISYKEDRGYGFIRPQEEGADNVYLHVSALQTAGLETIEVGQRLSYEILSEEGKNSAVNIKLLD